MNREQIESLKFKVRRFLPDSMYIKLVFKEKMKKKLDLKHPQSFNEKLQWLKLYDRNPNYTNMVDKYEVKKYISAKLGESYVIPTLGVWNKFEDIDFAELPNQFVLKCTHDSGCTIICKDKTKLEMNLIQKIFQKSLKQNFYYRGREWPYKNVKPRIIAEKFMTDSDDSLEFTDYKFFCFNGYVDCVMVCLERSTGDTKFYFFDKDWNLKRINIRGKNAPKNFSIPKPCCMDEMFKVAEKLSRGIPFVRVDLYQSNGHIYFGELTFFPASGFDSNLLSETDEYFGGLIDLDIFMKKEKSI